LNAAIGMVDQAGTRPLCRNGHPQSRQWQVGAQMIRHGRGDVDFGCDLLAGVALPTQA